MTKSDKTIEKITARRIKKLGPDEPSDDFTIKVMQTIALETKPEFLVSQKNYRWLIVLIPLCVAISWYIIVLLKLSRYVMLFWTSFLNIIQPLNAQFISLISQLKNLYISPLFLIGFIAVISLLTIEDLISRIKHTA
jgi:hypothetical protein